MRRCFLFDAMMPIVRTTLTIEDALLRDLKRAAESANLPSKEIVNRALRAGLAALERPPRRTRFKGRVYAMGKPLVSLDKALQLAGALETDEVVRKIELRK